MLTEDEARELVLAELARDAGAIDMDLAIAGVKPASFGWVFYWCARQDIGRPAGTRPSLGGNAPFLVDRENERLVQMGTGIPMPRQIADYERRLRREAHARNTAAKHASVMRQKF
ncbi:hypothetical protein ACWGDS_21740 [Streptomyces sp. NPDC055059]|uniref:hypothetical protein n=1 Tax=Streptomyces sp. NPDC127172 TaxID=3345382 RepID=UPI003630592A